MATDTSGFNWRATGWWRALGASVVLLVVAVASVTPFHLPIASPFVGRQGTELILEGEAFRFVGVNLYSAAGDPNIYECGIQVADPEADLDAWFGRIRAETGARVVRFWAFQAYTAGGEDWSALDRVIRLATKHDLKLMPVLENQWADCTRGGYKDAAWYDGGYRQPYDGYSLSYEEHVRRVVSRYRDEPAIAAWMLMNEAESKTAAGIAAPEPLYAFTRDMSALVKSIDPNHLVTLGVIGGGQPGTAGPLYERLHALDTIDLATYHDYKQDGEAFPGGPLVLTAPLSTELYAQDVNWTWQAEGYRRNSARTWETWSGTLPSGVLPLQRIGLNFSGSYVGDVYVDQVQVGARMFDFEDGTTGGWQPNGAVTLSNVAAPEAGGRALKAVLAPTTGGRQIWLQAPADAVPGTPFVVRVYVDTPGDIDPHANTIAAAMARAHRLGKPSVVTESGMVTCVNLDGFQTHTIESRAHAIDAKLDAFFKYGGAGYLIWSWSPTSDCSFNFTSGDPLNAILTRYSAAVR